MNLSERNLIKYCKLGELDKIKELINNEDVNLNLRDKWDSTPLYYACLCGHLKIVEYLLENGARCEANTFDSERCQYGALTDEIRNVLREFKVNKTKLDHYELFLERLYEIGQFSDIVFEIKDRIFKAHKCILSARSEYFRLKFENKWKNRKWIIGHHEEIIPEAFDSILKYIYTGRFVTQTIFFKSCIRLARLFKLNYLIEELNKKFQTLHQNELQLQQQSDISNLNNSGNNVFNKFTHLSVKDVETFIMGKFGTKLSNTISVEPSDSINSSQINLDLKELVTSCFPNSFGPKNKFKDIAELTHDLSINLENEINIKVHKAFIVERCDYFKTFLNDPFKEISHLDYENNNSSLDSHSSIEQLHLKEVDIDVIKEIIFFIYSDGFSNDNLDEYTLLNVLITADLYLLASLKRKCANELINHINKDNLFELLKVSRLYDLKKLEFACISCLAVNIFVFESSQELRQLILEDAMKLKQRQETDSIDIIDDLRYAINDTVTLNNHPLIFQNSNEISSKLINSNYINSFDLLVEKEKKLNLIEKILNELNLEC